MVCNQTTIASLLEALSGKVNSQIEREIVLRVCGLVAVCVFVLSDMVHGTSSEMLKYTIQKIYAFTCQEGEDCRFVFVESMPVSVRKCFSDSETLKPDVAASSRYLANVYLDFDFECGTLDVVPIETEYICERVQHVINQPTNQKPPLRSMRPNNVNGRIAFISLSLYYTTRILTNTKPGHSYVRMCVKVYMARRV